MIFDLMRAIQQLSAPGMKRYLMLSAITVIVGLGALYAALYGIYSIRFVQTSILAQPFSTVMVFERENAAPEAIREINAERRNRRSALEREGQAYLIEAENLEPLSSNLDALSEQDRKFVSEHEHTLDTARPRAVLSTFFAFSPLVVIFAFGLVARKVASEVDTTHYPHLDPIEDTSPDWGTLGRFLGVALGINLILLIAYPVPKVGLPAYFVVNAYLIGRWCFNMIAFRRMGPDDARKLRRPNYLRIWLAGVVMTFTFIVPVINFVAPIVAAAFMTHLFERVRGNSRTVSSE